MKYNKYYKDNNIIHDVEFNGLNDIVNIIPNYESLCCLNKYDDEFIKKFNLNYKELSKENLNINIRYQKEYQTYGTKPKLNRVITQNINCYKRKLDIRTINIYYDLTNKYNTNDNIIFNRFVVTYHLIENLRKNCYNVEFVPVLFLKAFDTIDNNEYIYIKFNNLDINEIIYYGLIVNNNVSRILLLEIIKHLNVVNKDALDYNGYLLERHEKENIVGINDNDVLIDMFTSDNLFNGNIEHDSKVFYKKLILK